jgi:hypothetical protein
MRRFLSALILSLAGLLCLAAPAGAVSRYSPEPPQSAEEKKRQLGEFIVLLMIAGGIGTLVIIQGSRELWACLPRGRRPVNLDDYED